MMTGARLVGGLVLGLSAIVVGMLLIDGDQTKSHLRSEVIYLLGAVGFLTGWRSLGKRVGSGYRSAFGYGLRAAFAVALWSVLLAALYEIFSNITGYAGKSYMVAVTDFFATAVDVAIYCFQWPIILTAVVLGIACGLVTEYVSKIWP